MTDFLTRIRKKSERDRRIIALSVSGGIVAVIFFVWATMFIQTVSQSQSTGSLAETQETSQQRATVLDSVKRNVQLLFGEGGPIREFDLGLAKPVAYKQEQSTTTEKTRDLQALLDEFNASSSIATSTEEE